MESALFSGIVLVLGIFALIALANALDLTPKPDEDRQDDAG